MTLDANPSTRTLLLALSALAWGACADDGEPAVATVVDSAGVEIVTHLAGSIDTAEAWSLSAEPVVAIGSGAKALSKLGEGVGVEWSDNFGGGASGSYSNNERYGGRILIDFGLILDGR